MLKPVLIKIQEKNETFCLSHLVNQKNVLVKKTFNIQTMKDHYKIQKKKYQKPSMNKIY